MNLLEIFSVCYAIFAIIGLSLFAAMYGHDSDDDDDNYDF